MLSDSVLPAHRMRASTALSELAAKGVLSDLLPLLSRDRRLLHQRLKMLGFSALGDRIAIEHALCQVGRAPPLGAPPLPPRGKEATGPWIVATHTREDVHWMPLSTALRWQLIHSYGSYCTSVALNPYRPVYVSIRGWRCARNRVHSHQFRFSTASLTFARGTTMSSLSICSSCVCTRTHTCTCQQTAYTRTPAPTHMSTHVRASRVNTHVKVSSFHPWA